MIRTAELSFSGVATGVAAVLFSATMVSAQTASYTTFGASCPNNVGHIVPNVAAVTWGNTGNAWTLGTANQRWQQEIDAVEMPNRPYQMTSLQWREDNVNRTNPAQTLQLKILFGMTTMSSSTMTGTFATNATGAQTVVFDGPMSLPAVPGGNFDLGKFHYVAKLKAPYLYIPRTGENFLIEIINTTATAVPRYPDAFSGTSTMGTRVYASGNSAATSGTLGKNHMMVLGFGNTSSSTPAPVLSATGTPKIGTQFSVDCSGLTATTAAGLILGASKTAWGAFNLPLDLTGAGAPGCYLLVSFDVVAGLPIVAGSGKVTITIPNQPILAGLVFHNQFFVLDAAANAMKLTWSNAGTATIGN
ncbi:MAG: hypothetical protein H6832_12910 [Planctomycetes bacterium]|nr:hypothetical protein [Planctomycetota bacterium]